MDKLLSDLNNLGNLTYKSIKISDLKHYYDDIEIPKGLIVPDNLQSRTFVQMWINDSLSNFIKDQKVISREFIDILVEFSYDIYNRDLMDIEHICEIISKSYDKKFEDFIELIEFLLAINIYDMISDRLRDDYIDGDTNLAKAEHIDEYLKILVDYDLNPIIIESLLSLVKTEEVLIEKYYINIIKCVLDNADDKYCEEVRISDSIELTEQYRHLSSDNKKLKSKVKELENKVMELEKMVTHFRYAPPDDYDKILEDFKKLNEI